jgi:hypothetical protein
MARVVDLDRYYKSNMPEPCFKQNCYYRCDGIFDGVFHNDTQI